MRWMRLFLFALIVPWASAATFIWSGAAGDGAYSNPANWSGGSVPSNDGTAVLVFADAGSGLVSLSSGINVAQIQFQNSGGNAYTFTSARGAIVTLQNGLVSVPNAAANRFGESVLFNLAKAQAFELRGGSVEIAGSIFGPGTLNKTGAGNLKLYGLNLWTGGLNHQSGTLSVGQAGNLGAGTVRLAGGALSFTSPENAWVFNPVRIEADVTIGGSSETHAVFVGSVTLTRSATLNVNGVSGVFITGNLEESGGARQLTVSGMSSVVLTGTSRYTGGTRVDNGVLIFGTEASVPTVGQIGATPLGYVGVAYSDSVQSTFIDRINPNEFFGMLGFDTAAWQSNPERFDRTIDVSELANLTGIGSRTSAILGGEVKVAQGSDYRFGGGGGSLFVEGNLTARGENLQVISPFGQPLTLVLRGNNTFKGDTNVLYSVLVLDRKNTLPAKSELNLAGPGYVGFTERAELSPSAFLGRVNATSSPDAIVGLDSVNAAAPRTVSDAIDLSLGGTRTQPYYLGTSSKVILTGSITPTIGDALYLTAVKNGHLIVRSNLGSVVPTLVVGQANSFDPAGGIVELSGNNSFTGGTQVRGGVLRVSSNNALGSGDVSVGNRGTLDISANTVFSNSLSLASGARLSGRGTFATPGGMSFGGGAILAPGGFQRVGSMTFASGLTFGAGGVLEFDIRSLSSGGWDTFSVTGGSFSLTATLADPFTLRVYSLTGDGSAGLLDGFDASQSYSWSLGGGSSLLGFNPGHVSIDTSHFLNGTNGGAFFLSQAGNNLMVNFTPVPEPGTYVLFAVGALIVGWMEFRRRKS